MTNFGTILLLIVCVGIGYVLEPVIFSGINEFLEKKEDTETTTGNTTAKQPTPSTPETTGSTIDLDLNNITPADYPGKIILKAPHTITDANSGATMKLKQGTEVKPVGIEGNDLVIQPIGLPVKSTINIGKTNFKELVIPRMLKRLQTAATKTEPTPPAPAVTPAKTPEPAPPVIPSIPEPSSDTSQLDSAAIIALLKKDIQNGKVSEIKASQVTSWKAGGNMEFDGDIYQTGHVTFKAETILGVQQHEAIALIENGKIYKWMWASTKLEMR